jgi:hypothetical protein
MKRQLTKEENEIMYKSIIRLKAELLELQDQNFINLETMRFNGQQRDYEDITRDVKRRLQDAQNMRIYKSIQKEINDKNESIKLMEKQLKEGVEQKKEEN